MKVLRLLLCVSAPSGSMFNDSVAAAAARVIAGRCAGSANAIVNSDASSLFCRLAETSNFYTTRPDVLCRLIVGCMLRHALSYEDCRAANYR